MGKRFWDARRHDEYVRQRDAALQRQAEQREGTAVARDLDANWPSLAAEERELLQYLVRSGARCCIGRCSDSLLSRLVERGMLAWPPGVRPVLTDDLETVFMVPPALWAALDERKAELFPPAESHARLVPDEERRFAERVTLIACPGEKTPEERAGYVRGRTAANCGPIAWVTLLIGARLSESPDAPRPLSLSEYHQLGQWLEGLGATLAVLLREDAATILRPYPDAERILGLLHRADEVDALLAHWERLGIWVLAEREPEFPTRLRKRLKTGCLPLLFGAGPKAPLDQGGVCVIGSRDSPAEALEFARLAGRRAGAEGLVVISSDMRGVDREVVSAALEAGGRVMCVLSDSLEKAARSKRFREALHSARATLVTPFTPDVRFTVANAMRANRYQYALSDAAIVVETRQSGGVWSGAEENRKHRWVPAFVRTGANVSAGNNALLHLGLFPITQQDIERGASLAEVLVGRATHADAAAAERRPGEALYALFVAELARLDEETARSEELVARHFDIGREQARAWLSRARASAGRLRDVPGEERTPRGRR